MRSRRAVFRVLTRYTADCSSASSTLGRSVSPDRNRRAPVRRGARPLRSSRLCVGVLLQGLDVRVSVGCKSPVRRCGRAAQRPPAAAAPFGPSDPLPRRQLRLPAAAARALYRCRRAARQRLCSACHTLAGRGAGRLAAPCEGGREREPAGTLCEAAGRSVSDASPANRQALLGPYINR